MHITPPSRREIRFRACHESMNFNVPKLKSHMLRTRSAITLAVSLSM